jgi:hypothetical protein
LHNNVKKMEGRLQRREAWFSRRERERERERGAQQGLQPDTQPEGWVNL